jgi:hypothetical protein
MLLPLPGMSQPSVALWAAFDAVAHGTIWDFCCGSAASGEGFGCD